MKSKATAIEVFSYLMNLATYVPLPNTIPDVIKQDPFDNIFLGLASENSASLIISGDRHLLEFESCKGIQIVTPSEGVSVISSLSYRPTSTYLRQTNPIDISLLD
jgi:predicted nucleic acid-binding protein